jgi:hypothetical protein
MIVPAFTIHRRTTSGEQPPAVQTARGTETATHRPRPNIVQIAV